MVVVQLETVAEDARAGTKEGAEDAVEVAEVACGSPASSNENDSPGKTESDQPGFLFCLFQPDPMIGSNPEPG